MQYVPVSPSHIPRSRHGPSMHESSQQERVVSLPTLQIFASDGLLLALKPPAGSAW